MDAETKQVIEEMAKKLAEAIKPQNDYFELASKPFKSEEEKQVEEREKLIVKPEEAKNITKKLTPFKTDTFLDGLFLDHKQNPIGGLPFSGQFGIVGMPDAGKSILMEETALRVAGSGHKVLFVTSEDIWRSETPRFDLESRMKQKAEILKIDWEKIKANLYVMDTVTYTELNDWWSFAKTYKYACLTYEIELIIIDSVTVLQTYRGALKYRLMELIRFNQLYGITGLFVNQRSKEAWDSYDIAGGIGLAHNLDGTIIIDFGSFWQNPLMQQDYQEVTGEKLKRKEIVRIARVLGCRMTNFDRSYQFLEITSDGFLRLKKKGEEVK